MTRQNFNDRIHEMSNEVMASSVVNGHDQQATLVSPRLRKGITLLTFLALACSGCAFLPAHTNGGHAYGVQLNPLFDNSRDWGPSYLIGPSGRRRSTDRAISFETSPGGSSRSLASTPDLLASVQPPRP